MFPRLKERSAQQAGTLSGGEQQMLAVARGFMAEPVVLMIDELSLGLSPAFSMQLLEALLTLKKGGMTILLVEQNVQMALVISDYAYVLSQGRTDLEGPSRALLKNEQVRPRLPWDASAAWSVTFPIGIKMLDRRSTQMFADF